MLRLFLQELRFRRNAIIGWGLGLCFFPIIYVGLYPSFADQMANFQEILDLAIYQAMGITMASFEGYMASTVTNLVPVILSIYAVINGTGTLAGEDDSGRLELFLSLMAALPLVMAFGMISLFLGAFCSNRRAAAMLATVVVLVSYLGSNLAGMVSSLESLENFFLFHFYDATAEAFENGQQTGDLLILLGVGLVAFGLALLFFQRRDITVGAWPWQRTQAKKSIRQLKSS